MPIIKCPDGKYRIGSGKCMYDSKAKAVKAYRGYLAKRGAREADITAVAKRMGALLETHILKGARRKLIMRKAALKLGLRESLGQLSADDVRAKVNAALGIGWYVRELYDDYVIARHESLNEPVEIGADKHYKIAYEVDGMDVKVSADKTEVVQTWEAISETHRPRELREADVVGLPIVADDGVIRDCTIIAAGVNKTGRRRWDATFLQDNLTRFDGSMCYIDHPTATETMERPERSIKSLAGRTENAHWDDATQAVVADVKLLDNEPAQTVRTAFADDVIRSNAGLSIYWPFDWSPKYERHGNARVEVPTKLGGPSNAKFGVDFVTLPTAGGSVGKL